MTSQLFANIYLNELDEFIKHKLKIKFYIRYSDDFVMIADSVNYLESLVKRIDKFLKFRLRILLHPGKIIISKLSQGVDFLGYVVLPYYTILRTKTKRRMLRKINPKNLQSYLGLLKHCRGYKIEEIIKTKI